MNTVILLNRNMTICNPPTLVQGWGGEQLGTSHYSPKYNCHVLELPVALYNKFAESLMRAAHIMMRKWEPVFVEQEMPDAVREFWDGYNAGMDGHPEKYSSMTGYFEMGFRSAFLEGNPDISKEVYRFDPTPEPQSIFPIRSSGEPIRVKSQSEIDAEYTGPFGENDPRFMKEMDLVKSGKRPVVTLEPITAETHHKTLERIAREEGIDLTGIIGTANKAEAIKAVRRMRTDDASFNAHKFEQRITEQADISLKKEISDRFHATANGDEAINRAARENAWMKSVTEAEAELPS